jgi:hypothetical protein
VLDIAMCMLICVVLFFLSYDYIGFVDMLLVLWANKTCEKVVLLYLLLPWVVLFLDMYYRGVKYHFGVPLSSQVWLLLLPMVVVSCCTCEVVFLLVVLPSVGFSLYISCYPC